MQHEKVDGLTPDKIATIGQNNNGEPIKVDGLSQDKIATIGQNNNGEPVVVEIRITHEIIPDWELELVAPALGLTPEELQETTTTARITFLTDVTPSKDH